MKIWDCIKEIAVDRRKEFISNCEEILYYDEEVMKIVIRQDDYRYDVSIVLDRDNMFGDWQPVEKAVSFLEAVKSGKYIKLINGYQKKFDRTSDYMCLGTLLKSLTEVFSTDTIREIMLGENFIIEEEE